MITGFSAGVMVTFCYSFCMSVVGELYVSNAGHTEWPYCQRSPMDVFFQSLVSS
jgi:hypothetical protein